MEINKEIDAAKARLKEWDALPLDEKRKRVIENAHMIAKMNDIPESEVLANPDKWIGGNA